jgi:glucose/arabinose dehydrogenase
MKTINKILTFLLVMIVSSAAQSQQTKSNITSFATGFTSPLCIVNAGDDRLFVVDQNGFIFIVDTAGHINPQPFLDIHKKVIYGGEEGLLGLAFHPQFQTNGYFYVNYVGIGDSTHISRFKVSTANPDMADSLSEFKLMTIYQPFTNHKGGDLTFGPDGYLYIGLGDGGSAGDPGNRAQNPMEFLGKLLRIDVDHGNPYAIPTTNPFYGMPNIHGEIWAMGLRNPWRFSFDHVTGDLWIADVGQNAIEEIDFQSAGDPGGENYGWRCYEGNQVYNDTGCISSSLLKFPIYTYPHNPECSIIGGYVYRGSATSPYYGYYFFTDYCSDKIWTMHKVAGSWVAELFGQFTGNNFSSFGEDSKGQIYIAGLTTGIVYRIVDNTSGIASIEDQSGIKIMENPFTDKIQIETGRIGKTAIQLTLNDVNGSTIFKTTTSGSPYEFDTDFLPQGVYFLNIESDGSRSVQKLIKVK